MKKVLLCRPEGGLNDILCQVAKCYKYCQNSNRTLVIDTLSTAFRQSFDLYFRSVSNNVLIISEICQLPSTESVYPKLDSDGFNYPTKYLDSVGFVNANTSCSLTFNFDKHYEYDVLLHHNCGGGTLSFEAFSFLQFQPKVLAYIDLIYNGCPKPYSSLHLRGTDGLGTNYEPLLDQLAHLPRTNIFVATDSRSLLEIVTARLSKHNLFSYSAEHLENDLPLHVYIPNEPLTHNRSRINLDAIVDMVLLARAQNFYFVDPNLFGGWVSGYSRLADFLHSNKHLIQSP